MTPFGEYLEKLRKQKRCTQSLLAQKIGVSPGYLSALENGRKVPGSTNLLAQIAEFLQLTPTEYQSLLEAHDQSKLLWRVPANIRTEEFGLLSELWDQLGSLSTEKVQTIKMLLRLESDKSCNCSSNRKTTNEESNFNFERR